jgi:hypothetical protein
MTYEGLGLVPFGMIWASFGRTMVVYWSCGMKSWEPPQRNFQKHGISLGCIA